MWGPQVRILSNTLWSLTSVICWLPTERCADGEWSSCRLWRVVSIMYFVFDGLRDIWLRCVHWTTSERHDWRTVVTAGTSNVSHPGLKEYLILLFFWGACLSRTLRNTEYQVANASSGSVWLYTLSKGALLRSLKNSLSSNLAKDLYVGNLYTFFWPSAADGVVVADADYWHTDSKDVRDVSWVDMINESFWWRCDPGWGANSLRG